MSLLRQTREAILGETWTLPIGVGVILILAVTLREIAPAEWRSLGGPLLLISTLVLLVLLVERARPGRASPPP